LWLALYENKGIMKYLVVLLTSLVFITGCSSNQKRASGNEQPIIDEKLLSASKSEIRMYRPDAFLQMLANVNIDLDGRLAASLENESVSTVQVKPGKHILSSKMVGLDFKDGCDYQVFLEPGEVQYFSIAPTASGASLPILSILTNPFVCKFEIEKVAQALGKKEYETLTQ